MQKDIKRVALNESSFEHGILVVTTLLIGLGVVMVYSATVHKAYTVTGYTATLYTHLRNIMVAATFLGIGVLIPLKWVRFMALPGMVIGALLLMTVDLWGKTAGNATRWLEIGNAFTFQPGEFSKLLFVIWMAHNLSKNIERVPRFWIGFMPHVIVMGVYVMFFMWQPDYGSSIFLGLLTISILLIAGSRWKVIALSVVGLVSAGSLAIYISGMHWDRIEAFFNPEAYAQGKGFQSIQSMTSIAANGLKGAGLGSGGQSIAGLLPESQTDFIYSVIGEELGFLGVALISACFVYLLYRGTVIASRSREPFMRYLAFGLTLLIVAQAAINIGVNSHTLPTKGVPLPLVSLGGSNMIMLCGAIGLLLNISRHTAPPEAPAWSGNDGEVIDGSEVVVLKRG